MRDIKNDFLKNLIYTVVVYTIGVVLSNFLTDIEMKWSTFLVILVSLVLGQIIRYLFE